MSFGDLDNNTFKGLTRLLSVEQEIQYDEHGWIVYNDQWTRFNTMSTQGQITSETIQMDIIWSLYWFEYMDNSWEITMHKYDHNRGWSD